MVSTPQNSPNRQSPRTSTPSVDSAVGSAEGLGVPQTGNVEEIRPRSDGSDSLATSSALTSPEPPVPEINEPRVDLVQTEPPIEIVTSEPVFPLVENAPIEETVQKGRLSSNIIQTVEFFLSKREGFVWVWLFAKKRLVDRSGGLSCNSSFLEFVKL